MTVDRISFRPGIEYYHKPGEGRKRGLAVIRRYRRQAQELPPRKESYDITPSEPPGHNLRYLIGVNEDGTFEETIYNRGIPQKKFRIPADAPFIGIIHQTPLGAAMYEIVYHRESVDKLLEQE